MKNKKKNFAIEFLAISYYFTYILEHGYFLLLASAFILHPILCPISKNKKKSIKCAATVPKWPCFKVFYLLQKNFFFHLLAWVKSF